MEEVQERRPSLGRAGREQDGVPGKECGTTFLGPSETPGVPGSGERRPAALRVGGPAASGPRRAGSVYGASGARRNTHSRSLCVPIEDAFFAKSILGTKFVSLIPLHLIPV